MNLYFALGTLYLVGVMLRKYKNKVQSSNKEEDTHGNFFRQFSHS
jgi:hypothetical protein